MSEPHPVRDETSDVPQTDEAINGADRAGLPTSASDAWIAATALALNCPLIRHNAADF
jgi:predicted nucleic acid-binding protein